MKKLWIALVVVTMSLGTFSTAAMGAEPKSRFYDFSDQLIDGEIRRPTSLFTNVRQAARFSRMLELKKELLPLIFQARKDRVFK